jgi:hypothetical protein
VLTHHRTHGGLVALVTAAAGLVAFGAPATSAGAPAPVDPSTLTRGADPAVVYMVRDTIRDGDLRVPATHRGTHVDLWSTSRGYVVKDMVHGPYFRLVFVDRSGAKRVLARSVQSVAVSGDGTRIAWTQDLDKQGGPPSVVTMANPNSGRVIGTHRFRLGARVAAVTGHRVLLSRLFTSLTGTMWWEPTGDRVRKISDESVVGVDFGNDRIVFDVPRDAPACVRVARWTNFARTLWRSCDIVPHTWSPDGDVAIATHAYFDDVGTNLWAVVDGRTGAQRSQVTGRLDWDAVWEDNQHFLTGAQGDDGMAAIIRCTTAGSCERASRLWDRGVPDYLPNYIAPPVVLPNN